MEFKSSFLMYSQLRKDLLRASAHHRRAIGERMYASDIHRSYLRTCQRQLKLTFTLGLLTTVMQIHLTEPTGDILLFLTGQEDIDTSCEILYERMQALGSGSNVPELIILPVCSALPTEMQSRILEPAPSGSRKVIIATNIAETSITVDDVYYVIRSGVFQAEYL